MRSLIIRFAAIAGLLFATGACAMTPIGLTAGWNLVANSDATPIDVAVPSVCTVSGTSVSGMAVGTCTLAADQPGNANYNAAAPIAQNFTVGAAPVRKASVRTAAVNPASLKFATQYVGTSSPAQVVTLSNTGNEVLSIINITVSPNFTMATTCGATLAVAASCNISVIFKPIIAGTRTADVLFITTNATNNDANLVVLSGTAVIAKTSQSIGSLSFSPTWLGVGAATTASATSTSGLAVSFSSNSTSICTVLGNVVTGVSAGTCTIAADQAGNTAYSAAAQVIQTVLVGAKPSVVLNLLPSWNLVGNSVNAALDVAATLGDASKVSTVWKWMPASSKWAFYTPALADGGAAYAGTKGYEFLTVINGGEGFWVNAKSNFTLPLPAGTAISSVGFKDQPDPTQNKLLKTWNLIATGDSVTPSVFNRGISVTPPAQGVTPQNVTTLWAWDSALTNWYFYAPSLEASGGLQYYITSRGYLDFVAKPLDPAMGFWVNRP